MATLTAKKQIDCDGPVHEGMSPALMTRLTEMCALRDAALYWSDPEGVHQMRVASRRLRGALRDFAPHLPKRRTAASLKQIREIAVALGRVRDCDVAIATLERTATKAPEGIAAGIRHFAQFRETERNEGRTKLVELLTPDSLSDLTRRFETALMPALPRSRTTRATKASKGARTGLTYRDVARSIVLTRLEELEQLSKSLYRPLKIKPLHEMRLAAKHLRYALELFEPCWGARIGFFANKVAALQSSLGKLHDCDLWIEDFGETVTSGRSGPALDHRPVLVWLLAHFVKLRSKNLCEALRQWQEWEDEGFSAALRARIQAAGPV